MILNLKESAQLLKKEGKPLRVLVFLDDKYCDVLNFARRLIKFQPPVYTTPEEKMTTNEFHQLSFLFEGMTRSEKIMGNRELHSTIWNELHETNSIDAMEPHKYDYKCFPIHLFKNNNMLIKWFIIINL